MTLGNPIWSLIVLLLLIVWVLYGTIGRGPGKENKYLTALGQVAGLTSFGGIFFSAVATILEHPFIGLSPANLFAALFGFGLAYLHLANIIGDLAKSWRVYLKKQVQDVYA